MLARSSSVPRRARLLTVALAVGLALPVAVVGPALAETPDGVTALPPLLQVGPAPVALSSVSNSAVAYAYGQPGTDETQQLVAHALTDGGSLGTISEIDRWNPQPDPVLDGDAVVDLVREPEGRVLAAITKDLDGTQRSRLNVPDGDRYVASGAGWMLIDRPVQQDEQYPRYELRLLRADGSDRAVSGAPIGGASVIVQTGGTLLLNLYGTIHVVSVKDAVAHPVEVGESVFPSGWYFESGPIAAATPTGVWWSSPDYFSNTPRVDDRPVATVAHVDPDGSHLRTFELSGAVHRLFPLGEGLVGLTGPAPTPGSRRWEAQPLVRVDPTTGAIGATVLDGVVSALATPDGRVIAVTTGGQTGRLVELSASGTRVISDLPQLNLRLTGINVLPDRIVAGGLPPTDVLEFDTIPVYELRDGAWRPLPYRVNGQLAGVYARGDVLLVDEHGGQSGSRPWTLAWPGGSRTITSWFQDPLLDRDGRLVARLADDGGQSTGWSVENVRTGEVVDTVKPNTYVALDHGWVWWFSYGGTVLTGHEAGGSGLTVTRAVPSDCTKNEFHVWGRWALLGCSSGQAVYDLLGQRPPWAPEGADVGGLTLGKGYVTHMVPAAVGTGYDVAVSTIGGAFTRRLGIGDRTVIPDASGAKRAIYLDERSRPMEVDLSWLPDEALEPDLQAPSLTSTGGTPRIAPTRTVSFSYVFADPAPSGETSTGLATYDVRYRRAARAGGTYAAWVTPASWQATTRTSVSLTASPGQDTCFSVRARDHDGNLSAWSTPRCSAVDGVAPTVTATSAGPRMAGGTTVRFAYRAKDAVSSVTYDVAYRQAAPGRALGSWVHPTSWTGRGTTSVTLSRSAGYDLCFSVRAVDRAGNRSSWSPARCAAVPYDDRALSGKGDVTRGGAAGYYADTWTVLREGASLSRSGQKGIRVGVTALRGPGQGSLDVYLGSVHLGRITLAATSKGLRTWWLTADSTVTGSVRLVQTGSKPVRIDAVAVARV